MRMADLQPGWAINGNDDRRVGTVKEVGQNYLVASTGALGSSVYIPASAIANVDDSVIYLNVAQRDVAGMGWSAPPREGDAPEAAEEEDLHRHV